MAKLRLTLPQKLLLADAVSDGRAYTRRGDTSNALVKRGLAERARTTGFGGGWWVFPTEAGRGFVARYGAEKAER